VNATAIPGKWKGQVQGRTGWRLFFASILCGPLAGLIVVSVLGLIGAAISASSGGGFGFPAAFLITGATFGAVIGWPAMLVFGMPAHALLYRRKSHRIGGYLLAGVLTGFAASLALFVILAAFDGFRSMNGSDMTGGGLLTLIFVLGAVTASAIFWLIRRPDKDVMQPDKLAAMFE
jgi:hypothetical protein